MQHRSNVVLINNVLSDIAADVRRPHSGEERDAPCADVSC